jgi:flagellar basal-body rod modification protein FlgD
MSSVSGTSFAAGQGATASGSGSGGAPSVDYNAFLRLLITQLKNQDPTAPMDTGQFMAQLASFSNVEQGIQMNQKLDSLLTASSLAQADGVIGHTVTSADGSVTGVVSSVKITSDGPVATLGDGSSLLLGPGITVG